MSNDIECPYCGEEQDINHDDGFGYEEGTAHEMQCNSCQKNFVFQTHVSYTYFPEKADCLNGSPHNYGPWRKLWCNDKGGEVQTRRCADCDHKDQRTVAPFVPDVEDGPWIK